MSCWDLALSTADPVSKLVRVRMKTALPLLLTDLACGQPACSLCSSNVHSSRPCIVTSCVQSTMPSIGCANCTHICLRVCCSTSKDFFWLLSSHSLRNFTDSASMQLQLEHLHIRVFHRYFHPPRVQCPPVVQCILGSSEYRMRSTIG